MTEQHKVHCPLGCNTEEITGPCPTCGGPTYSHWGLHGYMGGNKEVFRTATLTPERIKRAAHRRGDDCAYMYGRDCDCQEPDRLMAALTRLEPTDERDIEAQRIENFLNGAAEVINQETGFPVFEHRVKVEWEDD